MTLIYMFILVTMAATFGLQARLRGTIDLKLLQKFRLFI